MLELIQDLPDNVIGVAASGEIRAEDYEQVLIPAVDEVLASHDKARLLYVLGDDFTGFSAGAMWEDGKVGMGHLTRWERMAVVTDHDWMRHTVHVFGFMIPGQVKVFTLAERDAATDWITA